MGIRAPSRADFRALLRIARASIADPPWFASPVEAHEDDEALTIVFHVAGHRHVRVDATERSATISAPGRRARAMRICSLPCAIEKDAVQTTRSKDLLRVRIPKKRQPAASRDGTQAPVNDNAGSTNTREAGPHAQDVGGASVSYRAAREARPRLGPR
jgi:HSP20 family molecular chaperone IbpA